MPVRRALSSGAAVVDEGGRVLLLHRAAERRWCLPKGGVEPGESRESAAIREVREETGLEVRLEGSLGTVRYGFYSPPDRSNVDKEVAYFLARPVRGHVTPEAGFDRYRWATQAQAARLLRWPNDREIVSRAYAASRTSASRRTPGPAQPARH